MANFGCISLSLDWPAHAPPTASSTEFIGLFNRQFNDHQPAGLRDGCARGQNFAAVAVARNLRSAWRTGGGGAGRLDVSESRNIAPDQAQLGMRDDLVLRINNVSNAALADLARAHEILNELEIDLRNHHPATCAGDREGHVGFRLSAKVERPVVVLASGGVDKLRVL